MVNADGVALLVLAQKALDAALRRLDAAEGDTQIILGDLAVANFVVQNAQRLGIFRRDDDAASVAVDAVAEGGGEGVFLARLPLALLIEVGEHVIDERVDLFVLVGVGKHSRGLVEQHDVFVLIDDLEPRRRDREIDILFARCFEELVVDVALQHVARDELLVALGARAVDLDAL